MGEEAGGRGTLPLPHVPMQRGLLVAHELVVLHEQHCRAGLHGAHSPRTRRRWQAKLLPKSPARNMNTSWARHGAHDGTSDPMIKSHGIPVHAGDGARRPAHPARQLTLHPCTPINPSIHLPRPPRTPPRSCLGPRCRECRPRRSIAQAQRDNTIHAEPSKILSGRPTPYGHPLVPSPRSRVPDALASLTHQQGPACHSIACKLTRNGIPQHVDVPMRRPC